VTTTLGDIALTADESATINAISTAASLAASIGGQAGLAVSGAGAAATNVILGKTNAYAVDSTLVSAGAVSLDATNESDIHAVIAAASGAFAGFALGASVALNQIGDASPIEVMAYLQNSDVTAAAELALTAHSEQAIEAVVVALSVAITAAGSGAIGFAASGSGVYAERDRRSRQGVRRNRRHHRRGREPDGRRRLRHFGYRRIGVMAAAFLGTGAGVVDRRAGEKRDRQ
jgi:hypothetical protein